MRFMLIILLLTAIAFGGCNSGPSNINSNGNGNSKGYVRTDRLVITAVNQ